jgi:hypothetical protein
VCWWGFTIGGIDSVHTHSSHATVVWRQPEIAYAVDGLPLLDPLDLTVELLTTCSDTTRGSAKRDPIPPAPDQLT